MGTAKVTTRSFCFIEQYVTQWSSRVTQCLVNLVLKKLGATEQLKSPALEIYRKKNRYFIVDDYFSVMNFFAFYTVMNSNSQKYSNRSLYSIAKL
jgi:hypothetical protein